MKMKFEQKFNAVITELTNNKQLSGKELRENLEKKHKIRFYLADFYMLMSKIEEKGYVEGWYEREEIDGCKIKTKYYRKRIETKTS